MKNIFRKLVHYITEISGSPSAFILSLLCIIIWGASGHHFHYSDTWELVINTGTTIVTFLMGFLIQNTQNRESRLIHIKLDDIINSLNKTHKELIDLDEINDEDLKELHNKIKHKININ